MAKRIYWESIKKWAIRAGIPSGIAGFAILFYYLIFIQAIIITGHSGDMSCKGTIDDPCIALINFTANEDIFIYPVGYDPWGRNTPFETDKALKSWKMYRSWGKSWREIKLDKTCTATWCGAPPNSPDNKYSFAFREGRNYSIKIVAYKENPKETIKWGFGDLDPYWYGEIGYEIYNNTVEIWNTEATYYFNKSSGIQWTQDPENYWSRNIFCIGYYSGGTWNKIKCADELGNFNRDIQTDNTTYVNATLWKDFTYSGYDMRLGVRYHLKTNDEKLSVIIYGKNRDNETIPYDLGFAWKVKDIKIANTEDDRILINNTLYNLEDNLDLVFKNMSRPHYNYSYNNVTNETTKTIESYSYFPFYQIVGNQENGFINLDWNKNLDYKVKLYSDGNQANAHVSLLINAGSFSAGQEKSTIIYWQDPDTRYEWYSDDVDASWIDGAGTDLAQSFRVGTVGTNESFDITQVSLELYRDGTPGTITVELKTLNDTGIPPDSFEANLSYGSTDGDTLTESSGGEWRNISMSSYTLTPGSQYVLIVTADDSRGAWRIDTSGEYDGGNGFSLTHNSSWVSSAGYDFSFEVYGIGAEVDAINPNVTINTPANITYSTSSIFFNITCIDDILVDGAWVTIDGGVSNLTLTNSTMEDDFTGTNSSILEGGYSAQFYCKDNSSNVNGTESIDFSVTLPKNLSLEGFYENINAELGSGINATATSEGAETLCIDINHPEYGINSSCGTVPVNITFNFTYFRKEELNDSSTWKNLSYNGPQNQTIYISSHQYAEIVNFSMNISGFLYNDTYPTDIKVYINNTLSNNLGLLFTETISLDEFNDSRTDRLSVLNETGTDIFYLRLPKTASVISAHMNLTDTPTYYGSEYYAIIYATDVNESAFNIDTVSIHNLTGGRWKLNSTDSYNISRAKIMERLFKPVEAYHEVNASTARVLTGITDLTNILTPEDHDKDRRAIHVKVHANSSDSAHSNGNFTFDFISTTGNENVSIWGSSFKSLDHFALTYLNGILKNYQSGEGTNNTYGADMVWATEDNPVNFTIFIDNEGTGASGAFATVQALILTKSGIKDITFEQDADFLWLKNQTFDFLNNGSISEFIRGTNDTFFEAGSIDGTYEWNWSGAFTTENRTSNFNTSINSYLATCTADIDGYCYVPLYLTSDTPGIINITDLEINYTYDGNPLYLNINLVDSFLGNSSGISDIAIKIENSKNGTIQIDDINFDYAGGNDTIEVLAHTPSYSTNISRNVTFFYSNWNYEFPSYVNYLEFIPSTPTSKNVTPFGQTGSTPIFNITTYNYGGRNMNLSIYLNETHSCVNLTFGINSTKTTRWPYLLNNTWRDIDTNIPHLGNTKLWFWADYNCNYTSWRLWYPEIYIIGCAYDIDVCSEEIT